MSNEDSNIKDVIDATTGLVKAIPIYVDLVQPAAKEIGHALGTVAKTVNLVLAPVSGVVWSYDLIRDFVTTRVSEKLKTTPLENIVSPNPVVAGPTLEALKYSGHEKILSEMYANLLANAVDVNTLDKAHPSFVEIIKQLSPMEAKLLLFLSELEDFPNVCQFDDQHTSRGGLYNHYDEGVTSNQIKFIFEKLCSNSGIELDLGAALDNYRRLQILDIEFSTTHKITDANHGLGRSRPNAKLSERLELEISHNESLFFTSFGLNFVNICVKDKT